jgi:hypothetical protein
MMDGISRFSKGYFSPIISLLTKKEDKQPLKGLKIASYFTIIIPAAVATVWGLSAAYSALRGRVQKIEPHHSPTVAKAHNVGIQALNPPQIVDPVVASEDKLPPEDKDFRLVSRGNEDYKLHDSFIRDVARGIWVNGGECNTDKSVDGRLTGEYEYLKQMEDHEVSKEDIEKIAYATNQSTIAPAIKQILNMEYYLGQNSSPGKCYYNIVVKEGSKKPSIQMVIEGNLTKVENGELVSFGTAKIKIDIPDIDKFKIGDCVYEKFGKIELTMFK